MPFVILISIYRCQGSRSRDRRSDGAQCFLLDLGKSLSFEMVKVFSTVLNSYTALYISLLYDILSVLSYLSPSFRVHPAEFTWRLIYFGFS